MVECIETLNEEENVKLKREIEKSMASYEELENDTKFLKKSFAKQEIEQS